MTWLAIALLYGYACLINKKTEISMLLINYFLYSLLIIMAELQLATSYMQGFSLG